MIRKILFLVFFAGLVFSLGIGLTAGEERFKIADFTLKDFLDKPHALSDYSRAKAVVIAFVSTRCPVSNAYNSRMEEIHKKFKEKEVVFLGINSNFAETVAEIKEHAEKNGLSFTILKDWDNKIADKLKASFTPEIFVLNSEREILYHGRIDDSRRLERVTSTDLKNALEEILSAKPVTVEKTKAFGCTIKRVKK